MSVAGHTITFSRASDRVGVILALICVDCDDGLWAELQSDLFDNVVNAHNVQNCIAGRVALAG